MGDNLQHALQGLQQTMEKCLEDDPSGKIIFATLLKKVYEIRVNHSGLGTSSQFSTDVLPGYGKDTASNSNDQHTSSGYHINPVSLQHSTSAGLCPICATPVGAAYIQSYSEGKRMDLKMQSSFCRAHREASAKAEWISRGYPNIDWSVLGARVGQLHEFINGIIDGKSCYYRDKLEQNVRSGRGRTLLQGLKSTGSSPPIPGYYGLRGSGLISEAIILKFGPRLRNAAIVDRLISARGVAGFVQCVLVPEVAVQLMKEDMAVDDHEARGILKDSSDIGYLLSVEEEDIIEATVEGV